MQIVWCYLRLILIYQICQLPVAIFVCLYFVCLICFHAKRNLPLLSANICWIFRNLIYSQSFRQSPSQFRRFPSVGFGYGFGSRAWFVGDSVWFEMKLFGFYYYYLFNGKWEAEKRATANGFNGFDTLFNQFKTSLMSHSTTHVIEYI